MIKQNCGETLTRSQSMTQLNGTGTMIKGRVFQQMELVNSDFDSQEISPESITPQFYQRVWGTITHTGESEIVYRKMDPRFHPLSHGLLNKPPTELLMHYRNALYHIDSQTNKANKTYKVIRDLKRIEDGWSGPNSLAPSKESINALHQIFVSFGWEDSNIPSDVEIDEEGIITMIWILDNDNICSIDIIKNEKIICTYTDEKNSKLFAEEFVLSDNNAVFNFFSSHGVVN